MASATRIAAALLAWTGWREHGRCQGEAWFLCRLQERAASLVRFLVHLGMRAAGAQSSSHPLLPLCTVIQMASRCPRVLSVKDRHLSGSMIVGGGDQIHTVVGAF